MVVRALKGRPKTFRRWGSLAGQQRTTQSGTGILVAWRANSGQREETHSVSPIREIDCDCLTYQVSAAPAERTRGRRLLQTGVRRRGGLVRNRMLPRPYQAILSGTV